MLLWSENAGEGGGEGNISSGVIGFVLVQYLEGMAIVQGFVQDLKVCDGGRKREV